MYYLGHRIVEWHRRKIIEIIIHASQTGRLFVGHMRGIDFRFLTSHLKHLPDQQVHRFPSETWTQQGFKLHMKLKGGGWVSEWGIETRLSVLGLSV